MTPTASTTKDTTILQRHTHNTSDERYKDALEYWQIIPANAAAAALCGCLGNLSTDNAMKPTMTSMLAGIADLGLRGTLAVSLARTSMIISVILVRTPQLTSASSPMYRPARVARASLLCPTSSKACVASLPVRNHCYGKIHNIRINADAHRQCRRQSQSRLGATC